jgi:hypothetical protein
LNVSNDVVPSDALFNKKFELLPRPFITRAHEGGWFVLRNGHGWLCGDRRQALNEFASLVDIERGWP